MDQYLTSLSVKRDPSILVEDPILLTVAIDLSSFKVCFSLVPLPATGHQNDPTGPVPATIPSSLPD